jgi:putative flippase GtrA
MAEVDAFAPSGRDQAIAGHQAPPDGTGGQTGHKGRVVRFGLVGITATALYALIAFLLTFVIPGSAAIASLIAFSLSGVFSYFGHRRFTFQSHDNVKRSASRFACVNAFAYGVSAAIPLIVTDTLAYRPEASIALVCIVIPVMNYLLLNWFVFRGGTASR